MRDFEKEKEMLAKVKLYKHNYSFLLTDFILRWIALAAFRFDYINDVIFWIFQIFLIPFTARMRKTLYNRKHGLKTAEDGEENEIAVDSSSGSVVTSLFYLFCGVYITFNLYEDLNIFLKILISIATFFVYGFYISAMYISSYKVPSTETELEDEAESYYLGEITGSNMSSSINTDSNDLEIVKLEGILNYTNDRVNSYILESALFSGLAFAGFITLITSEKLHVSEISTLLNSIKELLNSLIEFKLTLFLSLLDVFSQSDLFIFILVESLFCTLAFISVIASRLRFSDILEEIEISVKTARSLNDKEEEVALLHLEANQAHFLRRITYLNKKIEKEITIANHKLESIIPLLNAIRVIRSIGMIFFFSMIFTSALLINSFLASFVLVASILVTIVMNIDHSFRIKKVKKFNFQLPSRATPTRE